MEEHFRKIDFFAGLDDRILKKVAETAMTRQYGKGEVIVRQGEIGLGMYVILKGRVSVDREENGGLVRLAELGPEQFFAEMSVLDNRPRSASITTLEDTQCLLLTRDSFTKLMTKYPEIPIRLARLLAQRIREVNQKLAAPSVASTQQASPPPSPLDTGSFNVGSPPVSTPGITPEPARSPGPPTAASPDKVPAAAQPASNGFKAGIQKELVQAFENLYMMKAFTRFSVAVLGCPVEGTASNVVEQIRIGDVKAFVFPVDEKVELDIAAQDAGSFTLHVFVPYRSGLTRFGPVPIRSADHFQLLLDPPSVALRHAGRLIPPA